MELCELKERIKQLGMQKLDKKITRLEERRWFMFLRLRFLAMKLRFLERL